jgi:hypothetical protein
LGKQGSKGRSAAVVVVTPDARINRSARAAISRLGDAEYVRMSLERYASARHAPLSIVICPAGDDVRDDLAFLEDVRRRLVWPPPSSELWSAIAGLRGSHDPPPAASTPPRRRSPRRTALLLEGDVTLDRARRAAAAGGPRDWIVERVQRVRVRPRERDDLHALGVRWAVLEPVDVRAIVATPALLRARGRWASLFPRTAEVWSVAGAK